MEHLEPATRIVGLLGGPRAVAQILGVDRSRVLRWRYPRERGGTGGVIPHWHVEPLIRHAKAQGIRLRPEDFAVRLTEGRG